MKNSIEEYEKLNIERQKCVDAILSSNSKKKIVLGGPGTGKTYLFKNILVGKDKTLTLTFVNALVDELSLELYGYSEVKTLHGFALGQLKALSRKKVRIFPKLSIVIKEDAQILLKQEIEFDNIFYNMEEKKEYIEFYRKRKDYYDYYGFSDIIYAIVKYYDKNKDTIPSFQQVIVDEFQDFNKLEVSLIELLSEKSPILLTGDDDQALYDFKSASKEHIRNKHTDRKQGFEPFILPFCSRCTKVIIDATNDIIVSAKMKGYLSNRINKPYKYFAAKE